MWSVRTIGTDVPQPSQQKTWFICGYRLDVCLVGRVHERVLVLTDTVRTSAMLPSEKCMCLPSRKRVVPPRGSVCVSSLPLENNYGHIAFVDAVTW